MYRSLLLENFTLAANDQKYFKEIDPNDEGYLHKGETIHTVLDKDRNKVGGVGFSIVDNLPWLHIVVDPKYRGKSLFEEFVRLLMKNYRFDTLYSKVKTTNKSSQRAHEKMGFKKINYTNATYKPTTKERKESIFYIYTTRN
jgi:RimJ/RimL family protein N-acetyltransferase